MIIKKKRIRNINGYTNFIPQGDVIPGVVNPSEDALKRVGFKDLRANGDTILPAATGGPITLFNAEGKEKIERDQPKETAYRTVEWHWKEWHGRDHTIERSKFVDVPYERYPRSFITPPAIELTLTTDANGNRIVVCPNIKDWQKDKELLTHSVNLLLEIFGECTFFDGKMNQFVKAPLKRLNWRILPPGKRPWTSLEKEIKPLLDVTAPGKKVVIKNRLETINSHQPSFSAVGEGGFTGYIVLGFPEKNLFLLESLFYGNATYVFGEQWEELSKKSKAEILDRNLQKDRIVHREGWELSVNRCLTEPVAAPVAN